MTNIHSIYNTTDTVKQQVIDVEKLVNNVQVSHRYQYDNASWPSLAYDKHGEYMIERAKEHAKHGLLDMIKTFIETDLICDLTGDPVVTANINMGYVRDYVYAELRNEINRKTEAAWLAEKKLREYVDLPWYKKIFRRN